MKLSYFLSCFNTNQSQQQQEEQEETGGQTVSNSNFSVFSYNQIKTATQGFRQKIGEGGFGSVYKGRLQDGIFVAVKVLSVELESMRGEREFISEIAALSDIKHENLVTLRGCCIDGAKRLLVYDYMENNSLLHTFLGGERNRMKFSWTLRRNISLGIAKALSYLHEEVNPHIIHRDIKASNILLDENFTPKLADFGLARLFRENMSHISTRVAGTMGYLSPEYATSGHLTRKSDVYSFGVLLLEIVSGRPVIDYHLRYGDQFLVEKAWESYSSNNLLELVDPVLSGDFAKEEAIRFIKVGLLCVQETTKLRPRMSRAFEMLTTEMETEEVEISRPGIVADMMELKIRQKQSSHFSSSQASSSTGSFQARLLIMTD
ncbi:serine threonine- kinase isoform X1 [Olea europaea subsp. europaea]|uniref:Serine threonine- kinase isoform X1 n=2 Tax=Olea europaea subsp. europaea TaxID=158383 RepID=A0A8S0RYC7_OLEEU|nr:serine threonine- kinase isoform X1 [Olea europaea subsp. europaea]